MLLLTWFTVIVCVCVRSRMSTICWATLRTFSFCHYYSVLADFKLLGVYILYIFMHMWGSKLWSESLAMEQKMRDVFENSYIYSEAVSGSLPVGYTSCYFWLCLWHCWLAGWHLLICSGLALMPRSIRRMVLALGCFPRAKLPGCY